MALWDNSRSPIDEYPELVLNEHIPLLKGTIWLVLVGSLLFAALVLESPHEQFRRVFGAGTLALLAGAALVVLRRLGPAAALRLLAFGSWVLATGASMVAEGVRTPVLISYPVILMYSGWLLGARYCLILFAASCVAVVAMAFAQHSGVIVAIAPLPPLIVALAHLIILSISAALTLYLLRLFQKRYAEARQLNTTLQSSEMRFRDLLQSVPAVAVQGYAEDGTTRYWNRASEKLYGYTAAEAIGRNRCELIIPPEMRAGVEASMRQMFESGQPIAAGELSLMRKDGSRVDIFSSHSCVQVPGQAPEMFCLDIDLSERKRMEDALLVKDAAIEASLNGIAISDLQGRLTYVNPAFCRMWGIPAAKAIGHPVTEFWRSREEPGKVIDTIREQGQWVGEMDAERPDGQVFSAMVAATSVRNRAGEPICMMGAFTDVSERKRAEKALAVSEERLAMALSGGDMGLWDWHIPRDEVLYSDRWYLMLGLPVAPNRSDAASWTKLVHPDDLADVNAALQSHLKGETPIYESEYRVRHADGHWVWLLDRGKVVEWGAGGAPVRAVGTYMDITGRKHMEAQVRQMAFYDALTGLPNRRLLSDRMIQAMIAHKRSRCHGALMFLDLDNFKPLNDLEGHEVGDLLLVEVAARLRGCVREMDTVARFGGDEFVVLISELAVEKSAALAEADIVAEKIRATLANPYKLTIRHDGAAETTITHRCTVSIGVAMFLDNEATHDDILRQADAAMYQAKEAGRNSIRLADSR